MSDNGNSMSFADMFEEKGKVALPGGFEPGEQVEAVVVRISGGSVFLDIGGKSEGYIDRSEFLDREGNLTVKEGDVVKAFFLSANRNEMLFTTNLGSGSAAERHLEDAFHSKIPVEGQVVKEIKGGYEIKVAGSVRAFCPFSQLGVKRVEDTSVYIGETYSFLITQFGEAGRNVVVSRRQLMEEKKKLAKEELRQTLKPGMPVKGEVTSIRDFGAFIDIGGIEGLIPVSEIGWGRVEDIRGVLTEGQKVEVVILKLDWENDRYSFSLKAALPDPWDKAVSQFPEGSFHTGKVSRLTNFGAFVTLAEGIDGLVHISNLGGGRRINHPREVVSEGQDLEVRVDSVDRAEKRISLSLAAAVAAENEERQEQEEIRKFMAQPTKEPETMGTLGDLLKKKLG